MLRDSIKQSFIKELATIVGRENVLFSKRDLLAYSYDATSIQGMPEVVVLPLTTTEVSAVMKIAYRERIPVIPRGAGTNLSGGTVAVRGGVILELSRMNRILTVDTANRRVVVEPGVVNLDLGNALAPLGFIYPPDPSSQKSSTLGGNIAENAGGPRCLKYGVTSKYVCGMEIVLPAGEIVDIGGSVEDIPGYDLRGLLIGSEGTLGIATKLVLHIIPQPEASRTLLAIFETLEDAGQAVSDIISVGIVPGALELMDKTICQVIEQSIHAGYPVDAEGVLLIELEGFAGSLDRQTKDISVICQKNKVRELRLAQTMVEQDAIWQGRRGAFGAIARISSHYLVTDGTVPRTKLVPALRKVGEIAEKYHLLIANVAHAGDGNLHPLIMFNSNDRSESAAAEKAGEEILDTCLALGGTITGEHGIGLKKMDAMFRMFSSTDLATMGKVKLVFDLNDILNPGKLLPPDRQISADEEGSIPVTGKAVLQGREALYQRIAQIVGTENVMTGDRVAVSYEVDGLVPIIIVFVSTTEQVSQIVKIGNQYQIPIVPWGSGSKQQVGPCLSAADMVLCLKHMNQIVDLDSGNFTVQVEAGIVNSELQRQLAEHKFFFPLDPLYMDASTIGGELAANATGRRRVAYGTVRDLVLGITVVTPTGDIIHAGGKTIKNVAGIDLCKMFIGSWGTLGIITQAVLRLFPLPEVSKSLCLTFPNFEDVSRLITQLLNSALSLSSVELIDGVAGGNLGYGYGSSLEKDEVLLMVNVEGSIEIVERQLKEISTIAEMDKVRSIVTTEGEEATRAWNAYRSVHQSILNAVPSTLQGKASVPISKLGNMFKAVRGISDKYSVEIGVMAHCCSGILYLYVAAKNADVVHIIDDLKKAAVGLGGYFMVEAAPLWVRKKIDVLPYRSDYLLMKRLKTELDLNNILNPGRVVGGLY